MNLSSGFSMCRRFPGGVPHSFMFCLQSTRFWFCDREGANSLNQLGQPFGPGRLALPDLQNRPAGGLKLLPGPQVPLSIPSELGPPELLTGLWHSRELAVRVGMLVPEATMDEDRDLPGAEYDIGTTGEILRLQPIAQARGMECLSHSKLGLSVPSPDERHLRASSRIGELSRRHRPPRRVGAPPLSRL